MIEPRRDGRLMAKVATELHGHNTWIVIGQFVELGGCCVLAAVVDENQLPIELRILQIGDNLGEKRR